MVQPVGPVICKGRARPNRARCVGHHVVRQQSSLLAFLCASRLLLLFPCFVLLVAGARAPGDTAAGGFGSWKLEAAATARRGRVRAGLPAAPPPESGRCCSSHEQQAQCGVATAGCLQVLCSGSLPARAKEAGWERQGPPPPPPLAVQNSASEGILPTIDTAQVSLVLAGRRHSAVRREEKERAAAVSVGGWDDHNTFVARRQASRRQQRVSDVPNCGCGCGHRQCSESREIIDRGQCATKPERGHREFHDDLTWRAA